MCVYDAMAAILNNLHNFENAQGFTSGPPTDLELAPSY